MDLRPDYGLPMLCATALVVCIASACDEEGAPAGPASDDSTADAGGVDVAGTTDRDAAEVDSLDGELDGEPDAAPPARVSTRSVDIAGGGRITGGMVSDHFGGSAVPALSLSGWVKARAATGQTAGFIKLNLPGTFGDSVQMYTIARESDGALAMAFRVPRDQANPVRRSSTACSTTSRSGTTSSGCSTAASCASTSTAPSPRAGRPG